MNYTIPSMYIHVGNKEKNIPVRCDCKAIQKPLDMTEKRVNHKRPGHL